LVAASPVPQAEREDDRVLRVVHLLDLDPLASGPRHGCEHARTARARHLPACVWHVLPDPAARPEQLLVLHSQDGPAVPLLEMEVPDDAMVVLEHLEHALSGLESDAFEARPALRLD